MSNKLSIVPTPIGNLEDITLRALRVLREADLILAEDTRVTGKLLKHFEIDSHMRAYHQHNEHKIVEALVEELGAGKSIALVSDAGTPGISDPGFLLIRECLKAGIEVDCLPGAAALIPALVQSGIPCDRFCFEGFLPQKKGRQSRLEKLKYEDRTMVFYESPYRVVKTLQQLAAVLESQRIASVSRELSKLHEETLRGTLEELAAHFEKEQPRGEFVIVVAGQERKKSGQGA